MSRSSKENAFGAEVRRVLREQGALVYPLVAGRGIPAGWPDVLCWHPMWAGLIELKGEDTPVEPAQAEKLWRLHEIRPRCAVMYRMCTVSQPGWWGRLHFFDPTMQELHCGGPLRVDHLLATLRDWRMELECSY